jgi:uroporphyrinogen III methyltransferase/synthase
MNRPSKPGLGTVYLVGSGPGDPGMVTLRAVECLRRADVVLYDYLVNPRILSHVRENAEQICLGRHGAGRIVSQEEINNQLIALAKSGKTVVRLKSGDPAVFARGAEEAEAIVAAGLPFEIVPGITAALAAGSCAGIPITHRDHSSAVALITGQESPTKSAKELDYGRLAEFPGTLVFYMGVTTAESWIGALLGAGKPADTPVAIVRRCSFPDQRMIRCRLDEVVAHLETPRRIRPPVIFIVGQVADAKQALDWFEQRPLFGQTVLVTRPSGQAASLQARLEELGANVLIQPAISIGEPADWRPVDNVMARLQEFDWLVFSSTNGVDYFFKRLLGDRDLRSLAGVKIAAVGPGTTKRLAHYHLHVDYQPEEFQAEALAAGLTGDAENRRFLLIRASRGREVLVDELTHAGGIVEQVVVYDSKDVTSPDSEIAAKMSDAEIDWVTVTSSAIAKSLSNLFGESLETCKLASISPVTSATLRELRLEPAVEAAEYTMEGVVAAILNTS